MKNFMGKIAAVCALVTAAVPAFAAGTVSMPAVDLTDFYAAVGIILGVSVAVMIVKKVRGQIK